MSAHLSKDERDRIAQYRFRNYSQAEIAKLLNRSPSTISRELKRNAPAGKDYFACPAETLAETRRRQRPLVKKLDQPSIKHAVNNGLVLKWSPEQIAGRM
jgi:IS30 family transposase